MSEASDQPRNRPLIDLLDFALSPAHRADVAVQDLRVCTIDSARANEKREGWVKFQMNDELLKSLRGSPKHSKHAILIVVLPMELVGRAESRIVLPGEKR